MPLGGDICYYLGSRFYSPRLGRFLNADKHTDTGTGVVGTNMFAYCNNNPVMFIDPTGESMQTFLKIVKKIIDLILLLLGKNQTTNHILTEDEKIFIATVAGEAIGENEKTWSAVAHVIKNRVGYREWKSYTNTTDVIKNTGFDGYLSSQYNYCMNYLNNRTGNDATYERLIEVVLPIYQNKEPDCTSNSVLFYNPALCSPTWDFSVLQEVIIDGVNRNRFRFYKYK